MSCPWGKVEKPEPMNLNEIMSEEVAKDRQAKEEKRFSSVPDSAKNFEPELFLLDLEVIKSLSDDRVESDHIIAQMLQMQYDKEFDDMLQKTEQKFNGTSKVSISFENFRRVPQSFDFESDDEEVEIEDICDRKDWDRFDTLEREVASIPNCGYKMQNGSMVTKHDLVNSGRKNACKLLSFPPEFQTGDGENFDLKLSNKVFNSLKMHSKNEQARRHKLHDKKEDHATTVFGVDAFTRLLLYKMINNQLLQRVNGVISIGKEAVILHADTDPSYPHAQEPLPKECVIKVFKTILSEFKQRDKYIRDDHRFKDRIGKQNTRKIIQIWAEKEMANLMRLRRAGINCPQVIHLKQHILVMSFIGEEHKPAPKLKEATMKNVDYIMAYEEVISVMKTMYEKANLIHADLSEYNILWHNKQCYFIDVSQSVEPSHENAFHFLYRDCYNIVKFFSRKEVPNVLTAHELFETITGLDYNNRIALEAYQKSFRMKPHLVDRPGVELPYDFDSAWEQAKLEHITNVEKVINNVDQLELIEPPQA